MESPIIGWEGRARYAPVFIRLFAGVFLVYMSQDNVLSWARMREFEGFLRQQGFPAPLLCAVVSVASQFTCGLLFLLGAFVRWAALVMVVNFVAAIVMVHLALPFREALDPAAMLASALSLAYSGAGALSVDGWRASRSTNKSSSGRPGKK